MAQNATFGYTDTNAASPLTIGNVPKLSYATDFAVSTRDAKSVVLSNTTSPLGWPETLRFSIQDVANVYSGTDIDPVLYAPIKKGKSLVCSLQDTAKVGTGAEAVYYPISAHFVLKFPNTSDITVDNITTVVKRMIALAFKDADDTSRIEELIHGVMDPQ